MEKTYRSFIKKTLQANEEIKQHILYNLKKKDYLDNGETGAGGDISKEIDLVAENIFITYLSEFGDIMSEESGFIASSNKNLKNKTTIIIDPLDGSDNFLSNLPYYGTSVSLRIDNIPTIALVYNLINDSYIFRTPLETNCYENKFLKSNFGIFERSYTRPDIVSQLLQIKLKFRSPGATALSLATTHNYQFFLLAGKTRDYDIDAGLFICNDLYIFQNEDFLLVSKNIEIFENIKEIIKGY